METAQPPPAPNDRTDVPGAAAFGKFMRAVQAIADAPGELTVASLAKATGVPRPTAHRIVAALVAEGMAVEDRRSGRLTLGPRLISLAFRSWDRSDIRRAAQEHLVALRDAVDETVHLAIPSGPEMVYIEKLESRRNVRMASRIGTRVALHSSSVGKAWLAALSPAHCAAIRLTLTPRTSHTFTERDALMADVEATRARGYALDLQENELDICCYGAAIVGRDGLPVGCVSVSMPRYRFEEQPREPIVAALARCVGDIAASVGAER